MKRNRYVPPTNREITFPREAVPRPIAVWLLLLVLSVFVAFFAINAARFLFAVVSHASEIRSGGAVAVAVLWRMLLITVFAMAALAIYHRWRWSRWLGVALIVGLGVCSLLGPDTTRYANEAERAGGFLGRLILLPPLLAWWGYAFGFSSKAKRYFAEGSTSMA